MEKWREEGATGDLFKETGFFVEFIVNLSRKIYYAKRETNFLDPFMAFPQNPSRPALFAAPDEATLRQLAISHQGLMSFQGSEDLPRALAAIALMAQEGDCWALLATAPTGFAFQPTTTPPLQSQTGAVTTEQVMRSLTGVMQSLVRSGWEPTKDDTLYLGFHMRDAAVLLDHPPLEYIGRGAYGYRLPEFVVRHYHQRALQDAELVKLAQGATPHIHLRLAVNESPGSAPVGASPEARERAPGYDDGFRDAVESMHLALAADGVSPEVIARATQTVLDAFVNNAPDLDELDAADEPRPLVAG